MRSNVAEQTGEGSDLKKNHFSKDPQASTASIENEPILPQVATEGLPLSSTTTLPALHSQKHHSKLAVAVEGLYQPVGWLNGQPNSRQDAEAQLPFSTARHPLMSLSNNVLLNGGAQESHQTHLAEESEDGDKSLHDNADNVPGPNPSLWF